MPCILRLLCGVALSAAAGTVAHADVLSTSSPTIRNNLCVGFSCANDVVFNSAYNPGAFEPIETPLGRPPWQALRQSRHSGLSP